MITFDDETVQSYVADCGRHLGLIEYGLVSLEMSGAKDTKDIFDSVVEAAQAVESGAGLSGLTKIGELARELTRTLSTVRARRALPTARQSAVVQLAIDTLRKLLADPEASGAADLSAILEALAALPAGAGSRILLVEDDFTSRLVMQTFLSRYGDCHVAVNGLEAVQAFRAALEEGRPYQLICMDIMMPEMDGGEAVRQLRALEEARGILSTDGAKIIMTTAVNNLKEVARSFHDLCDAYLVKPIDLGQLLGILKSYRLTE
jgi:two-component system chemotaxis response regulator CheY